MSVAHGHAARSGEGPLAPFAFERREPRSEAAHARTLENDVKYRFVIDMASIRQSA